MNKQIKEKYIFMFTPPTPHPRLSSSYNLTVEMEGTPPPPLSPSPTGSQLKPSHLGPQKTNNSLQLHSYCLYYLCTLKQFKI